MKPELSRRWAMLAAKLYAEGKLDTVADIVLTVGEAKRHPVDDDHGVFLQSLRDMLDETGMDEILKVSEKRRKALEKLPKRLLPGSR